MTRTLLIDADLIAYRSAAANEQRIDWGDGVVSHEADLEAAKQAVKETVEWIADGLKATDLIICMSDEVSNFRKGIDPTYKSNRNGTERPVHLYDVKDWMAETWPSRSMPHLEADDVMGILATEPHTGERIIVSNDKDMRTIPGLLCAPPQDKSEKLKVERISLEEADRFHLYQTIVGDTCDGYPGCPGEGPVAAERLLRGLGYESFIHTFKSGPRKGTEETRWKLKAFDTPWQAIVSAYEKKGLTEAHALTQARLAFILRSSHYQDGNRLDWTPPN